MTPFHYAPAIIPTALDDENLLPQILPDIPGPQQARIAVEVHLPRLPQAIRPVLRARVLHSHERIVGRNRVVLPRVVMIDVDPQDRSGNVTQVLSRHE